MIVSREREKLLAAMVFFCRNTKYCHTLKLFKLLNFLDFEHYRQTGRSVTGLDYAAFEMGPVPSALWNEIRDDPKPDMKQALAITTYKDSVTNQVTRRDVKPKIPFNSKLFSKRELEIMRLLALFFHDIKGDDMSDFSHLRGLPWKKVFGNGEGKNKPIPIDLALTSFKLDEKIPTIEADEIQLRNDLRRGVA